MELVKRYKLPKHILDLDDILDKIYNMKLPKYLNFRTSEGNYRLSPEKFFWCLTQVILVMSREPNHKKKYPTISQLIYSLVGENKLCTGSLILDIDEQQLILKSGPISIKDEEKMDILARKILEKKSICKNFAISLSLRVEEYGHHNSLFIDYGKRIKLYLYEPHGIIYDRKTHYYKVIDKFLSSLKEAFERIEKRSVIIVNQEKFSCPNGIQAAMEDKIGFCITISFFWVYCLLTLAKDNDLNFINRLESDIIQRSDDRLKDIVENFAVFFSLYVFEFMKKLGDYDLFENHFRKCIEENKEEMNIRFIPKNSQYTRKGENPYNLRERSDVVRKQKEKVNDGSECKYNSDCLSENCVNNRCVPYKY